MESIEKSSDQNYPQLRSEQQITGQCEKMKTEIPIIISVIIFMID